MLNLAFLASPNYRDIMPSGSNSLINAYTSSSGSREMARIIALSLGAPIQYVARATSGSVHTFAALLYMYEQEYMGVPGKPGVWGQEYTDVLARENVPRLFDSGVGPTDMLCMLFNPLCSNTRESYIIFNKFVQKYDGALDGASFGKFITYLINITMTNVSAFIRFLRECESGALIKAVMDAVNESKMDKRVRDFLLNLRKDAAFAEVSLVVTTKIVAALATPQ